VNPYKEKQMSEAMEARKAIAQKVAIRTEKRRRSLGEREDAERELRLMGFSLEERERAIRHELNCCKILGTRYEVNWLSRILAKTQEALRLEAERKQKEKQDRGFFGLLFGAW
jgi:hypothetical protein